CLSSPRLHASKMTQVRHVSWVVRSATWNGKGRGTLPPALPRDSLSEGEERLNPPPKRPRCTWGASLSHHSCVSPLGAVLNAVSIRRADGGSLSAGRGRGRG